MNWEQKIIPRHIFESNSVRGWLHDTAIRGVRWKNCLWGNRLILTASVDKSKEKKEVLFFKCDCGICLLPIPLNSSNLEETLCDKWVLSTSVCVARSPVDFCYATTEAERRPLVVSVPIPLRTQLVGTPTRRKIFLRNYGKQKSANEHLTQTHMK